LQHLEKAGIAGFFLVSTAVMVWSISEGLRLLRSLWSAPEKAPVYIAHALIDVAHKVKTADVESFLTNPLDL